MTTTTRKLDLNLTLKPVLRCKWMKCGGQLAIEVDDETRMPYHTCIQCGREHDMQGRLIPKGRP